MERSESLGTLERLADAFVALVPDTPGLMVDRATRAPPDAIGWPRARNFRVRLGGQRSGVQASAYYRASRAGLELMLASSRSGAAGSPPLSEDGVADLEWGPVRLSEGDEPGSAERVLERLRDRLR